MDISIDFCSYFYKKLSNLDAINNEEFSIFINGEEVRLPIFVATLASSKITENLYRDSTIRKLNINIDFTNENSKNAIISILNELKSKRQVSTLKIEEEEELSDIAKFGALIGNDELIKPIISIAENDEINNENALKKINAKDTLSYISGSKLDYEKEIEYIANNFVNFCNDEKFIEWCRKKGNEERVEKIVRNESLHLNNEDDLFNFIMKINNEDNRFINLFAFINLQFCSFDCCKQLTDMLRNDDALQSKNYRESIIECISKRLLHDIRVKLEEDQLNKRYSSSAIEEIKDQNSEGWNEEIQKLKEELKKEQESHNIEKEELTSENKRLKNENESLKNINKRLRRRG